MVYLPIEAREVCWVSLSLFCFFKAGSLTELEAVPVSLAGSQ